LAFILLFTSGVAPPLLVTLALSLTPFLTLPLTLALFLILALSLPGLLTLFLLLRALTLIVFVCHVQTS
jgi:hypothetical protein